MKTIIVQAFLLATLVVLGACAPAPEVTTREVATSDSPPGTAIGYSGQVLNVPETPAGITVKYGPLDKGSRERRTLAARQTLSLISLDVSTSSYI